MRADAEDRRQKIPVVSLEPAGRGWCEEDGRQQAESLGLQSQSGTYQTRIIFHQGTGDVMGLAPAPSKDKTD